MTDQPPTGADWQAGRTNEPPNVCAYPGCGGKQVYGCDCCNAGKYCVEHRSEVGPKGPDGFRRCPQCVRDALP